MKLSVTKKRNIMLGFFIIVLLAAIVLYNIISKNQDNKNKLHVPYKYLNELDFFDDSRFNDDSIVSEDMTSFIEHYKDLSAIIEEYKLHSLAYVDFIKLEGDNYGYENSNNTFYYDFYTLYICNSNGVLECTIFMIDDVYRIEYSSDINRYLYKLEGNDLHFETKDSLYDLTRSESTISLRSNYSKGNLKFVTEHYYLKNLSLNYVDVKRVYGENEVAMSLYLFDELNTIWKLSNDKSRLVDNLNNEIPSYKLENEFLVYSFEELSYFMKNNAVLTSDCLIIRPDSPWPWDL